MNNVLMSLPAWERELKYKWEVENVLLVDVAPA